MSDDSILARFWAKVEKRGPDECWPWLGTLSGAAGSNRAYGLFWENGRSTRAHRKSWEIANKDQIPDGMLACHACDNPTCVNPSHIWIGTSFDNVADAFNKGRMRTPAQMGYPPHNKGLITCKRGHPFSGDNLRISDVGKRTCRTCHREMNLTYLSSQPSARKARRDRARARAAMSATPPHKPASAEGE